MNALAPSTPANTTKVDPLDLHLQKVENLATAPQVLPQLLRALREENTEVTRIVDLISFDPGLTAKVLRACNSAHFARSERITDVCEAINLLGFYVVYQMVAAASANSCLKSSRPEYGVDASILWKHSVTSAFAAQFVAEEADIDAGLMFTTGLLHDLGKAVMAEVFKDDYGLLLETGAQAGGKLVQRERERFGLDHAEAGARMMTRWKFSPLMIESVRHHHAPILATEFHKEAACLELADALAHTIDHDYADEPPVDLVPVDALAALGLGKEKLEAFLERIRENLQFVEALVRLQG